MRQIEPRNCRLGCQLYRTIRVQALDNDCLCRRDGIGMLRYARDNPVSATGSVEVTVRNRTVQLQTAVGGVDPGVSALHIHRSQEFFDATGDDLLDGSQPAITGVLRQLHLEAIAVHDSPHFIRRNEDAVLHPFDAQEAVAGTVSAYDAFNYTASAASSRSFRRTAFAAPAVRSGSVPVAHLRLSRGANARAAR